MAGLLLLLTTLATLATLGSCHLADPGDPLGHYLARRQNFPLSCYRAKSNWTYNEFKKCHGDIIIIDDGNGTIDLSGWTDAELVEIFDYSDNKEMWLNGGVIIKNSQITGKDVKIIVYSDDSMNVIVNNNPNLVDFYLEIRIGAKKKTPRVRISGNRLLNKKHIEFLNELLITKQIQNDSHIQGYQECDLEGKPVDSVAATLKDCKAIYGDLIFDASSKFPADEAGMKSIDKLAYVQGCLRITGTQLKSWKDLPFLEGTRAKEGGCTRGHEISGNSQMCIHPPEVLKLKAIFRDITMTSNQKCTPECTSRHVLEKADSSCEIITDSLIIDDKTTNAGLTALKNVREIRGLLQITNTSITDFNYLPKLTKLNSNNMSAGHVINLQHNTNMTRFELSHIQASGVGVGRPGQIKFWTHKNGAGGNFTGDDAFLKRVDPENSRMAVPYSHTLMVRNTVTHATTTEAAVTAVDEDLEELVGYNIGLIIGTGLIAPVTVGVLMVAAYFLYSYKMVDEEA